MIPDSLEPGIVIRAPDKTSARESGDEANALCSNGSKNRQVETTVLRLSSLIWWNIATLLRFLCAECCFQRVTVFLYFFVI